MKCILHTKFKPFSSSKSSYFNRYMYKYVDICSYMALTFFTEINQKDLVGQPFFFASTETISYPKSSQD